MVYHSIREVSLEKQNQKHRYDITYIVYNMYVLSVYLFICLYDIRNEVYYNELAFIIMKDGRKVLKCVAWGGELEPQERDSLPPIQRPESMKGDLLLLFYSL
jgi:hypothetical protein